MILIEEFFFAYSSRSSLLFFFLKKVRPGSHASGESETTIFFTNYSVERMTSRRRMDFMMETPGGLELAKYYHLTGQEGAPDFREFTDEAGLKYTVEGMINL